MRWSGRTAGALVALIVCATVILTWIFWTELTEDMGELSTTLRNIGLLSGGAIAIVLTIWRSSTSEQQTKISQQQVTVSEQSLLNQRYERGVEMLGSDVLIVRIGGIYALANLARERPRQYHIQAIESLCGFVRHPTPSGTDPVVKLDEDDPTVRPIIRGDVQAALNAICKRSKEGIEIERSQQFRPDLSGADLRGINAASLDFSFVDLPGANLSHAQLQSATFVEANLRHVKFNYAYLGGTVLLGAVLVGSDMSHADARGVKMLNNLISHTMYATNLETAIFKGCTIRAPDMRDAVLTDAIFTGAMFEGETRNTRRIMPDGEVEYESKRTFPLLTQSQLDTAMADRTNPPIIAGGVVDNETGKQIVWNGKDLNKVTRYFVDTFEKDWAPYISGLS